MNKIILLIIASFFSTLSYAQDKPEMADIMRKDGKIYDVVAVCLTILIGLFVYVFFIDRKISKIEKNK